MASMSAPLKVTRPLEGRTMPPIRRMTVVLPQPEPPITATTLPRGKRIDRPASTGLSPAA
ncbi:hypothetical protein D3C87_1553750 [compost metagenome]